jgi:hypothetical protein
MPDNNPEISLKLTLAEVTVLLAAVGKRPLEEVIEIFVKIRMQMNEALIAQAAFEKARQQPGNGGLPPVPPEAPDFGKPAA